MLVVMVSLCTRAARSKGPLEALLWQRTEINKMKKYGMEPAVWIRSIAYAINTIVISMCVHETRTSQGSYPRVNDLQRITTWNERKKSRIKAITASFSFPTTMIMYDLNFTYDHYPMREHGSASFFSWKCTVIYAAKMSLYNSNVWAERKTSFWPLTYNVDGVL